MTFKELISFTRTKPDGRPGLGFGVILLVMVVVIVGGLYVINIVKWAPTPEKGVKIATPNSDAVRSGASPVEQPLIVNNTLPDDTASANGQSLDNAYRQSLLSTNPPVDTNSDNGWIPVFDPKAMPSVPDNHQGRVVLDPRLVNRNGRNPGVQGSTYVDDQPQHYYFPTDLLLKDTLAPKDPTSTNKVSGFTTHHFLPRGSRIPVVLMNKVNTAIGALPVELAIAKDVEFNGRIQLPFGWKIFGTASSAGNHKVNISANMILDPLGREYPITGLILNTELEAGLDGYANPNPLMNQILPTVTKSINTFMNAAKETITQQTLVGGGSGGSNLVANTTSYALSAKNALLDGTAQVMSGLMERKVDELNKMYPEGDTVPVGTIGYVLITRSLDLNLGAIGGSDTFLDKDQASPSPRTLSVKEQQSYSGIGRSASPAYPGQLPSQVPANYGIPGSGTPTIPGLGSTSANSYPQTAPKGLE